MGKIINLLQLMWKPVNRETLQPRTSVPILPLQINYLNYITGYSLLIQCAVIYRVKLDRASHTGTIVYLLGDHIANIFVQACYQRLSNLSTVVRGRTYVCMLVPQVCTSSQTSNYTIMTHLHSTQGDGLVGPGCFASNKFSTLFAY